MIPDLAHLPPMDVAARAARLRAALDDAGCDALLVTNLTNVRYLTGFTGSAALLLVHAPTSSCSSPTAATATRPPSSWRPPASTPHIEIGRTGGRPARGTWPAAAGGHRPARPGGRRRHLGPAAPLRRRDWFPDAELVPTEGLVEEPAAGEGRRRGGPHRGRLRHRRRRPGRGAAPPGRGPDRGGVRPRARLRRCAGSAPRAPRSRRSWPRAPTGPSPTTGPAPAASARATSSSSTSAPWSTATART